MQLLTSPRSTEVVTGDFVTPSLLMVISDHSRACGDVIRTGKAERQRIEFIRIGGNDIRGTRRSTRKVACAHSEKRAAKRPACVASKRVAERSGRASSSNQRKMPLILFGTGKTKAKNK